MVIKDRLGNDICVGDWIVYGKSDRDNPINVGKVLEVYIEGEVGTRDEWYTVVVMGLGNKKEGILNSRKPTNNRIVVLNKQVDLDSLEAE